MNTVTRIMEKLIISESISPEEAAYLKAHLPEKLASKILTAFMTGEKAEKSGHENLIIGLSSPNGFERERCLYLLRNNPEALPDILLRCNDWVGDIRKLALAVATELFSKCSDLFAAKIVASMEKLSRSSRIIKSDYELLENAYCKCAAGTLNARSIRILPLRERKFAYNLLTARKILSLGQTLSIYKDEDNSQLLAKLLEYIYLLDPQTPDLCDEAISSKDNLIRERGLWCKYKKLNDAWTGIEKLLLDKCNRIQDAAIYIVRRHSKLDLNEYFVNSTRMKPSIPGIKGIEKCGSKESARLLLELLPTLSAKKLSQALTAVSVLLQGECEEKYWECLEHPSAGVRRTAIKALQRNCHPIPRVIYEKCISLRSTPAINQLLDMLLQANSWKRLPYTIKLYLDPDFKEYAPMIYKSFSQCDMYGSMTGEEVEFVQTVLRSNLVDFPDVKWLQFNLDHISITD